MNEGKSVKAQRAHFEVQESRTAENGLEIVIFVPEWSGLNISARFTLQGGPGEAPTDPRPYLRKAIETLQAELADIDKCPVHRLRSTTPPAEDAVEELRTKLRMIVSHATGGHSQDIDASVNDICVRISAMRNKVYQAGKDRASSGIERLVEALEPFASLPFDSDMPGDLSDEEAAEWFGSYSIPALAIRRARSAIKETTHAD